MMIAAQQSIQIKLNKLKQRFHLKRRRENMKSTDNENYSHDKSEFYF
jgi:hypothetical protein